MKAIMSIILICLGLYVIPQLFLIGVMFFIAYKYYKKCRADKHQADYESNSYNLEKDSAQEDVLINRYNFTLYNHEDRRSFFTGNYFNKKDGDRFTVVRKLNIIEPAYIYYTNKNGGSSERKIDIFGLQTLNGTLYLYGFCHKRGDATTFNISSILLLIDRNGKEYDTTHICEFIIKALLPHVSNNNNKKIIINCLERYVSQLD